MKYLALVKGFDPFIEEVIRIEIKGVFVNMSPFEVREGEFYPVEIGISVLDDLEIRKLEFESKDLVLQPILNVQKLTLLPVQRLTDIMTTVRILKRKRTPLIDVPLLQQLHQSRPKKFHGHCQSIKLSA